MIYEYRCDECDLVTDVVKSHRDMEREERCQACTRVMTRILFSPRLHLLHTRVEHPEWNPGLGCVVKNRIDRARIARERGLEEVGNESPDAMVEDKEKDRAKSMRWDSL